MNVTLNIGTQDIRVLALSGLQVKHWAEAPLAPGLVKDGIILQPAAVAEVISGLFQAAKLSRDQVTVSLSGLSFTYRILDLPRMKPGLVAEAITRGARREIPMALEELYLSWQVVGGEGEQLDYFVLGVARKPVDALEQTLAQAGIKPYKLDLKPLALARAANRESALIVSLEPDYFDIVIINRGIPAIMHTITPRGPDASIADNVQRLADEISRTVEFYNGSHPGEPIDRTMPLLLTGVLAGEPSVIELTSNMTGYTVSPLVPALELPDDLPLARYTTNLGLALKRRPPKHPPAIRTWT